MPTALEEELQELLRSKAVSRWYLKREAGSRKSAIYHFAAYVRWRREKGLSTDPDAWVEDCLHGNNLTLISHLDVLKDWCEGETFDGSVDDTRQKYYSDIRGFYQRHRVPLPHEPLELRARSRTDEHGRVAIDIREEVTAMGFLKMAAKVLNYSGVNVRDRSIMMTGIQSGMDDSTLTEVFNFVGFPQLAKHFGTEDWTLWDEEKVPVRVDLLRPKTDQVHYTFLDHDGVLLLKDWLSYRSSEFGRIRVYPSSDPLRLPTSDPIYVTDEGRRIRAYLVCMVYNKRGKQAGVNVVPEGKLPLYKGAKRRYPFHSHEVRDTIVTLCRRVGVDKAVGDFFVGHCIDKAGYEKSPRDDPEHFRGEYSKIAKYLNLVTGRETAIRREAEEGFRGEVAELRRMVEELASGRVRFAPPIGGSEKDGEDGED